MMRALYAAVSGLTGHMLRMDVIGNNIANVDTTGFKAGRLDFAEAFAQTQRGATPPEDNRGGTNPFQIGTGSRVAGTRQLYTQGSLQATGIATDVAVEGLGLFVLSDGSQQLFTRDGAFQIDSGGNLVSPLSGYAVQGYAYDRAAGAFDSGLTDLAIPLDAVEPAAASAALALAGNLEADSEPHGSLWRTGAFYDAGGARATGETRLTELCASAGADATLLAAGDRLSASATVGGETVTAELAVGSDTTVGDWVETLESMLNSAPAASGLTVELEADGRLAASSPAALGAGAGIATLQLGVADAAGEERAGTALAFGEIEAARDAGRYTTEATLYDALGTAHRLRLSFTRLPGANEFSWEATATETGVEVVGGGSGRVRFAADGSLAQISFDSAGGRAPQAVEIAVSSGAGQTLELSLDGGTAGAFDGLTMFAAESTLQASADGRPAGELLSVEIDAAGQLMALFSNGVSRPVGRLALAEFVNPGGLARVGENAYVASSNSGSAQIGAVGEGVRSTVSPGALEQSNVDLAQAFTEMIVAQRGFQANARVVTASDEVLTEVVNIRR